MFGTLKPSGAELGCGARKEWQHFYCGTCQSLGAHFGLGYRGLLSHDAVFLALLVDGLGVEGAGPSRTRCPMLPVVHRPTVSPDSVAMRYAASIQLLLADQWLADRAVDGGTIARATRPLLDRRVDSARATLRELGSDLDALIGFEDVQAETERAGHTSPAEAAEPTAAALALVFGGITALPGLPAVEPGLPVLPSAAPPALPADAASCEQSLAQRLEQLGRRVGQAIYLIDALEDLEDDLRTGDFNPCIEHDARARPRLHHGRLGQAERLLALALRELRELLAALPLVRHRAVLANILVTQLGARAQLARAAAARATREDDQRHHLLSRLSAATGFVRFAQAAFALVFALVTTTWARIAAAATETGGSESGTGTDTGTGETGSGETGGEIDLDQLPDLPTELPDAGTGSGSGGSGPPCLEDCINGVCQSLCGGLGEACGECGSCGKICGGTGSDCGQVCGDLTGNCLQGCTGGCSGLCGSCDVCSQGCGNGCSGCTQGCEGCSGCGQACNGCSGCGQGCNGCGQGCNGCGQGCNGCGQSGCNGC